MELLALSAFSLSLIIWVGKFFSSNRYGSPEVLFITALLGTIYSQGAYGDKPAVFALICAGIGFASSVLLILLRVRQWLQARARREVTAAPRVES